MESPVRSASKAENLGLAPVVAHKVVCAFGGDMRLVKGDGDAGRLEVLLAKVSGPV